MDCFDCCVEREGADLQGVEMGLERGELFLGGCQLHFAVDRLFSSVMDWLCSSSLMMLPRAL